MNNESEFDFKTTFPPLGHPEHHFEKYPNHPWLKDKNEIYTWIHKHNVLNTYVDYTFHDDLTVSVNGTYYSNDHYFVNKIGMTHIPVQFRKVPAFSFNTLSLLSAIGTPFLCNQLNLSKNKLVSFEGISPYIKESLNISFNNLTSFQHMPKFVYKKLHLHINNNPNLDSWDGFTNAYLVEFWKNDDKDNNFNLILNTPKGISKLKLHNDFKSVHNLPFKNTLLHISKLRRIMNDHDSIKKQVLVNEKTRKRKL